MPEPSKSRARRWLLEGAIVLAAFVAFRAWQGRGLASGPAPPIDGVDLAGEPVRLEPLGRPTLVVFVASWCGVCDAQEPNVAAVARDHDVIAIVSQSGGAQQVRRWLPPDLRAARIVVDPHGAIARRWGVNAFPSSFYLDGRGAIRYVEVGYTSELGMRLRLWLAST